MSNFESTNSRLPISSPPLRTWDFLETTLVVLIAYGVFTATGELALAFIFGWSTQGMVLSPAELQALWLGLLGRWQGIALIAATGPTIAVLWIAIRMAGREFAEYLALNWPTQREAVRAFGVMAIVWWAKVWSRISSARNRR